MVHEGDLEYADLIRKVKQEGNGRKIWERHNELQEAKEANWGFLTVYGDARARSEVIANSSSKHYEQTRSEPSAQELRVSHRRAQEALGRGEAPDLDYLQPTSRGHDNADVAELPPVEPTDGKYYFQVVVAAMRSLPEEEWDQLFLMGNGPSVLQLTEDLRYDVADLPEDVIEKAAKWMGQRRARTESLGFQTAIELRRAFAPLVLTCLALTGLVVARYYPLPYVGSLR